MFRSPRYGLPPPPVPRIHDPTASASISTKVMDVVIKPLSLRGAERRSNLDDAAHTERDCFAALAMTTNRSVGAAFGDQGRRSDAHSGRAILHDDAGRYGRRGDQGRDARGRRSLTPAGHD